MTLEEALKVASDFIEAQDPGNALNLYQQIANHIPTHVEARLGMAKAFLLQDKSLQAKSTILNVAIGNATDAAVLSDCAGILEASGFHDEAAAVRQLLVDLGNNVSRILNLLSDDLSMIDLGSSGQAVIQAPNWIAPRIAFTSLDALSVGSNHSRFGAYHPVREVIAPEAGPAVFHERAFLPCSSLLDIDHEAFRAFGLQDLSAIVKSHEVVATTLADVLRDARIDRIDYIKTDLEGMDERVVRSAESLVAGAAVVQMELRFLPLFEGEPYLDETVAYMRSRGFEVLHLSTETWRYNTEHRDYTQRGRSIFADTTFIKNFEAYSLIHGKSDETVVRYCLICLLSGNVNYAEYVIETHGALVDPSVRSALKFLIFPLGNAQPAPYRRESLAHVGFS